MGKSLIQRIREHLERLTRRDQADQEMKELYSLSDPPQGDSRGWRFNREELHDHIAGIAEDHGPLIEGVPVSERPELYLTSAQIFEPDDYE